MYRYRMGARHTVWWPNSTGKNRHERLQAIGSPNSYAWATVSPGTWPGLSSDLGGGTNATQVSPRSCARTMYVNRSVCRRKRVVGSDIAGQRRGPRPAVIT
ncbi:hypothetical protein GCM10012275_63580 [Longimycelium tulufanense]|uniref:Uncharacterized protein n=1 Tax=Longimycelium tulufanense TaxID=907463 RepID=A0A8J3FZV3_9PSEU|nr:hypothetical protein GCM10012275_63580 [Longimycelium tulufanense]